VTVDPARLKQSASGTVRALIDSAEADLPARAQLGGLEKRLAPVLTPGPGGAPPSSGPAAASAAGGTAAKLLTLAKIAVPILAVSGGAAWFALRGSGDAPREETHAAPGQEPASLAVAAAEASDAAVTAEEPPQALPLVAGELSPPANEQPPPDRAPPPEPPPGKRAEALPGAAVEAPSSPEPVLEAAEPPGEPPPEQAPPLASPAPPPAPVVQPPPAPSDEELALLRAARRHLRAGECRAALDRVEAHEARFEHGVLVEEREKTAIEALVACGQRRLAEARWRSFRKRFPRSAHRHRLEKLLAPKK
jgi:hypothetical protein